MVGALFALAVGRTPARLAALVLFVNVASSLAWKPDELQTVFWHLLVEDTLVLIALVSLLQRFATRWLLWTVAIQTLAVASHLPRLFDGSIRPLGYAWFEAALGYSLVVTVVVGAYVEGRRNVPSQPGR